MPSNKSHRKKKLSRGTKDNLSTIIDNLSIIIGRKTTGKLEPKEAYGEAFANTDAYISAISLIMPEIDELWNETNAKEDFLKIKRKRQFISRALLSGTIIISVLLTAAALVAFILLDHWIKWVLLILIVVFVMFGSLSLPQKVFSPYLLKRDQQIPVKYPNECKNIEIFVIEILKMLK